MILEFVTANVSNSYLISHVKGKDSAIQQVIDEIHPVDAIINTHHARQNALIQILLDQVSNVLNIKSGETDKEHKFTLGVVHCMGRCALGPVMAVDGVYYSSPSLDELKKLLDSYE